MKRMRFWSPAWVGLALLVAGCNTLGPQYKTTSALEGIIAGPPQQSRAGMLPPKALTVGLIASDATEMTLAHFAKSQQSIAAGWRPQEVRSGAESYDPSRPVNFVVEMLKSRFGRVQLIPDMNVLASLPQPAVGCVFDLRYSGINDIGGQRVNATSELVFLDADGAVQMSVVGRAYKHNPGGQMGAQAMAEWMTTQSSTVQQAIEDMRTQLDARLTGRR